MWEIENSEHATELIEAILNSLHIIDTEKEACQTEKIRLLLSDPHVIPVPLQHGIGIL